MSTILKSLDHNTEENWNKLSDFVPSDKTIIVYDIDDKNTEERFKIGDGVTKLQELPFINNSIIKMIYKVVTAMRNQNK